MSQFSRLLKFESLESRTLLHGDAVIGPIPDVTGDGRVDELDTALVSQQFGQHTPLGDADGDGIVGQADLDIVTASLGTVAHSDDAMKQAEHLELLGLALPSQASNMAVASGSWSDPAIWSTGSVPGAGDQVWIPAWHSVEVDTQLTEALKWVRVDGELTFSTAVDTSLVADTIIGTSTAHLDINTTNPNVTTKITFADLGPIDTVWDPLAVSRGLIWHGTSEINGAEKNPWTTYKPATAGQTSLMVADASGWQVGDRLILAGEGVAWVRGKGWSRVTQDDDVTIVAIDGQTITLDHPLQYSHEAMESQNPVTINLTRNVVFQSENTAIDRRGHLMFMHNSGQEISYVELDNLGRTDKSQPITRPDGLGNGLENRDGRYALHFHRAGADKAPAIVTGIAINGSPGWGLVNHDSNVLADHNVSYNVTGAHFVTELGTERGSFTNNVAVRAEGVGNFDIFTPFTNEFGQSGVGFWVEGDSRVTFTGNYAIALKDAGFVFFGNDTPMEISNNVSLLNTKSLVIWGCRTRHTDSFDPLAVKSQIYDNFLQGTLQLGYSGYLMIRDNFIFGFDQRLYYGLIGIGGAADLGQCWFFNDTVIGFQTGLQLPPFLNNVVFGGYYDNFKTNILIKKDDGDYDYYYATWVVTYGTRAKENIVSNVPLFSRPLVDIDVTWARGGPSKS